jgi:hypothetical protein
MHRELLIAKREKAKQLHAKGWSVNKIARHLVSNWRSVKRWIEMEDIHADNRGWKKGRLRKYDGKVLDRVLQIRRELREEESYFFGPRVVQANYARLYPREKLPTMSFITKSIREAGWANVARKRDRSSKPSAYMNYPQRALDKLGRVVEGVDFIGPRYIDGQSRGVHFLSRKYIRPVKYGLTTRVEGQTTDEALAVLLEDWKRHPLPDVVRMDNDPAFGSYLRHPRQIGRFAKVLLNLGITPVYSACSHPWNNGETEGYNSVFARKFWNRLRFTDEEEIDTEIKQFNLEYEKYNRLVGNNIDPEAVEHRVLPEGFELPKQYEKGLDRSQPLEIYWLRVVRQDETAHDSRGSISVLGEEIALPQEYINQFTLSRLRVKGAKLTVMVETQKGTLATIKETELEVENANFLDPSDSVLSL